MDVSVKNIKLRHQYCHKF